MEKFRLLEADEIECRVKQTKANGAVILLYKTARTDMDRLDEAFGAENWESDFKDIKGNLFAGIGVNIGGRAAWKWDCGIESRADGEGNEKKGEASDAFKRAGFKWGIGRELYTAPFIWIPADKISIKESEYQGKKTYKTFDTFAVDAITYDAKSRIATLSIVNESTGNRVFSFVRKAADNPQKSEPLKPNPPPVAKFICADCGEVIKPYTNANGSVAGVRKIATASEKQFGRTLCADCGAKAAK